MASSAPGRTAVLPSLTEGPHTLTLTAIDSDGNAATASVDVVVGPAPVVETPQAPSLLPCVAGVIVVGGGAFYAARSCSAAAHGAPDPQRRCEVITPGFSPTFASFGSGSRAVRLGLVGVALYLALTACSVGSTPAPADVATPETISTPPSQATAPGGDCENPYLPVVEGATWTRRSTTSLGESTQTATLKDVTPSGFTVERTGVLSGGRSYTYDENWSCTPEGLIQAPTDELAAIATGASGTVTVQSLSNEGVTLPTDVQAGDTWTETFNVDVVGPDSTANWSVTYDFQAIGMEAVTVPAGAFTAIHLTNHITWLNGAVPAMDVEYWFATGVGLVKSGFTMEGLSTGITELVSYSIP